MTRIPTRSSGLEAGANDYADEAVSLAVLLARVRAQLRQYEQSEDATFTVGPYLFKPSQKQLTTADGKKIRLTERKRRSSATSTAPARRSL